MAIDSCYKVTYINVFAVTLLNIHVQFKTDKKLNFKQKSKLFKEYFILVDFFWHINLVSECTVNKKLELVTDESGQTK